LESGGKSGGAKRVDVIAALALPDPGGTGGKNWAWRFWMPARPSTPLECASRMMNVST
jgi:hypothetical protein